MKFNSFNQRHQQNQWQQQGLWSEQNQGQQQGHWPEQNQGQQQGQWPEQNQWQQQGQWPEQHQGQQQGHWPEQHQWQQQGQWPEQHQGQQQGQWPEQHQGQQQGHWPEQHQWQQQGQWPEQHQGQQQGQWPEQHQGQQQGQWPEQHQGQQQGQWPEQHQGQQQGQWPEQEQSVVRTDEYIDSIADRLKGFSGTNRILQYIKEDSKKMLVQNQLTNNASFVSTNNPMYRIDGVVFRSFGEVLLFEPLKKSGALFFPNCRAIMGSNKREADYLVFINGKAAVLNIVDDYTHSAAKDAVTCRWYQNSGLNVRSYTSNECKKDPDWVVEDFLYWLRKIEE